MQHYRQRFIATRALLSDQGITRQLHRAEWGRSPDPRL